MNDGYLMAIDVGTGSVRAVLFTFDGHQVGIGQQEYGHPQVVGVPGSRTFDTNATWTSVGKCVRECFANSGVTAAAVRAVSATSMREGMVLYNQMGREIWACPNVDSRASVEAVSLIESGEAEELYQEGGDWVAMTAPARFRWIARHQPEIFSDIAHMGMLGDWVLTKLTGEFVTDPSLGSSSGMFNLASRNWSERALEICRLDSEVPPRIVEPGTVVGEVTVEAAGETGLRVGTPVVVGGADTQLGLLGIGVTRPGRFTIVGGSFWQHTMLISDSSVDPKMRLRTLCHVSPDLWMMEGIGFYSGIAMRWFRDAFCELEQLQGAAEGIDVYTVMERKAEKIPPGSNGVVGLFSNVMQASNWVHTAPGFVGFDLANSASPGRVECIRAIEESAGYVSVAHLRIIEEISQATVDEAIMTGGASRGQLWPQIVADMLGVPVHIPRVKESTALGAAMLAGIGVGLWEGVEDAAKSVTAFERTVDPDSESSDRYRVLYFEWLNTYRAAMGLVEVGALEPLWRAPGS